MPDPDVIVVGLGSMGAAAANELAGRGVRVLGLEAFWPAHDQGSGHGASRIIRQSYFEGADYVPLLRSAYAGWRRLQEESKINLITLCGGLYIGNADGPIFTGALAAAQKWGLPHEVLDASAIRTGFPTFAPAEDALAVWEQNAGFVRPEAAIRANLDLARARGADLRFAEPVLGWSVGRGGGVRVTTRRDSYAADRLVLAAGAWMPVLLADLGLPLVVQRQVMYWFEPQVTEALPHRAYAADHHPVYIEERHDDQQIYGFPMHEGVDGGMKIGVHRAGNLIETTADDLDRTIAAAEINSVQQRMRRLVPATGDPIKAKVCMYTMTPDEHFVLGAHPDHDQVSIAAGFSGHGFKFVPVIGEILADLAQHGHTGHPIGLFDPRRFLDGVDPAHSAERE
ncbi:N-methyl-L-tryptophan oxidase [Microlunatus elymi]|uniref:N-methyl-L-tryptophan oxidase n=1 Tax=Microlunatus elymi TaxID=2596828 RepID=A0A516Q2Q7_9ACTN|nr:N-methyl-L-tryptophan oxidase [Microlunatus elymi]QDP97715.1 N-methyl-L-tryptophan oxidase [Microlunatus elymi]